MEPNLYHTTTNKPNLVDPVQLYDLNVLHRTIAWIRTGPSAQPEGVDHACLSVLHSEKLNKSKNIFKMDILSKVKRELGRLSQQNANESKLGQSPLPKT